MMNDEVLMCVCDDPQPYRPQGATAMMFQWNQCVNCRGMCESAVDKLKLKICDMGITGLSITTGQKFGIADAIKEHINNEILAREILDILELDDQ